MSDSVNHSLNQFIQSHTHTDSFVLVLVKNSRNIKSKEITNEISLTSQLFVLDSNAINTESK